MTQQSFLLKLFEKLVRSNLYVFIFSRFIVNKFLFRYIFESDFKILRLLKKNNYFDNLKKPVIDIGANDGISYSNSNLKIKKIYIPYFKRFPLSPFAGIDKKSIIFRLKKSFFIKNVLNKINFKMNFIKVKKLDDFNFKPSFIKIDIEGHEYECILGGLKTIKKNKPILYIEYNSKINLKIYNILKKFNYKSYYYDNKSDSMKLHNKEKIFNIIYINQKTKLLLKNDIY